MTGGGGTEMLPQGMYANNILPAKCDCRLRVGDTVHFFSSYVEIAYAIRKRPPGYVAAAFLLLICLRQSGGGCYLPAFSQKIRAENSAGFFQQNSPSFTCTLLLCGA